LTLPVAPGTLNPVDRRTPAGGVRNEGRATAGRRRVVGPLLLLAVLPACSLILDPPPLERDADSSGDADGDALQPDDAHPEDAVPDLEADADFGPDDADAAESGDDADAAESEVDGGPGCGNGAVDPGEECEAPATRACLTDCGTDGTQPCGELCSWSECAPPVEECNGVDDDCDGLTDPGCRGLGSPCVTAVDCGAPELECHTTWHVCVVERCEGRGDFTPCEVPTSPDRSYDICIGGVCESPGCGVARCNPPGPHRPLSDTGQRSCFDDTSEIDCSGTAGGSSCGSTPFCGQDAQYGWDTTHGTGERFVWTGSTQPVVQDEVTGLEWQGCLSGQTGPACGGSALAANWSGAVQHCDALDWDGADDWRLPDRYELQSLVHYGHGGGPPIDDTVFPATPLGRFWTSDTAAHDVTAAWSVGSQYESVADEPKSASHFVRCVRSAPPAPWPAARFDRWDPAFGEPVVRDEVTGLIWTGCALGQLGSGCSSGASFGRPWSRALAECQDLRWGLWSDWYLPNAVELGSILDNTRTARAIDPLLWVGSDRDVLWSATTHDAAATTQNAWVTNLARGTLESNDKGGGYGMLCVRRP
jgi:hypothetical protein